MRRILALALGSLVCAAALAETVVYENDFATRTSAGAVPYGGWRSVNYVAGQLLANTNYAAAAQFVDNDLQDNWLKAPNSSKSNAYIDDDGGNYVARLGDDSTKAYDEKTSHYTGGHVMIRQRIGNTFSNGVITVTFDMLPPSSWWYYSGNADKGNVNRCVRLALGNENAYTSSPNSTNTPFRVGACYYDGGRKIYYLDGNGVSRTVAITTGHWLRYVVTVNMDTRKCGFSCYDLGTTHPELTTETPGTPFYTASDLDFASTEIPVSSISTVSIDGYAVLEGDSAARFDNIRIAHNGIECYVNDFKTRKTRSLVESTPSSAYSAQSALVDSFQYELTNDVLDVNGSVDTSKLGYDGWSRRHPNGKAKLRIHGDSRYLYYVISASGSKYARAAHPIGINATSGTLRFRGEIRTPSGWISGDKAIYLSLGNDFFFKDTTTSFNNGEFARVGVVSDGSTTNAYYNAGSGNVTDAGTSIPLETWYRIVITAHLDGDNKTFDYEMYRQGGNSDTAADGTLISSGYGLSPRAGITSISCFGVSAYGATDARFDNFRIWYTPSGSSEENLIYQNSLDTRRVYRLEQSMVGTLKSAPTGTDGWTRLGSSGKNVLLLSDGNAALSFGDGDKTYATAVHDLGGAYGNGSSTAQADICAPTSWQDAGGCANVWFGGDQYHEGNLNGGEYNYEKMAAFGFGITNATFAAFRGDRAGGGAWETSGTATAGHWYRFVVSSLNRVSNVSVYDMGTTQPTLATATPETPVVTFSNLPFRRNVAISCVGVSAMGVKNTTTWSHLLPGGTDARLKIDNIRFSHLPSGAVIFIK